MACPFRVVVGTSVILLASVLLLVYRFDDVRFISWRIRVWYWLQTGLQWSPMPMSWRAKISCYTAPLPELAKDVCVRCGCGCGIAHTFASARMQDGRRGGVAGDTADEALETDDTCTHPPLNASDFVSVSCATLNTGCACLCAVSPKQKEQLARLPPTPWVRAARWTLLALMVALHVEIFSHGAICRWVFGKKPQSGAATVLIDADVVVANMHARMEINHGLDGDWLFTRYLLTFCYMSVVLATVSVEAGVGGCDGEVHENSVLLWYEAKATREHWYGT